MELIYVCAVRAHSAYFQLCLTVVTAESGVIPIVTALTAGADEYLLKPFTRDAVLAKL
ncbi:MAG: hypothetical protein LAE24_02825 [Candidatus Contendobacter sp.]|nr:hypothetical protein [Candidatus Contendobacter sp.]